MKSNWIAESLIVFMALSLAGCASGNNEAEVHTSGRTDASEVAEKETEQYDIHEDNQLVWVTSESMDIDEQIQRELNQLLSKKGYDFSVKIVNAGDYGVTTFDGKSYSEYLDTREKNGEQTDIAFAGYNEYATRRIQSGYFMNLNEYLASEEGSVLYEYYPELMWDIAKAGDTIYTVPNGLSGEEKGFYYAFNEKYFTEEELMDFHGSLEEVEALIQTKEIPFTPVLYNASFDFMLSEGYSNWNNVLLSEETGYAEPFLTNASVHDYLSVLNEWHKEGLLDVGTQNLEEGRYLVNIGCGAYDKKMENAIIKVVDYSPVFTALSCTTGIVDASEKKDEALSFLTLMYTDSEVGNLLIYGIEGRDYVVEDGVVELIVDEDGNQRAGDAFVYSLVTGICDTLLSLEKQEETRHERTLRYFAECAHPSILLGYSLENSDIIEHPLYYSTIYEDICTELIQAEDFERKYSELEKELEDLGEADYIASINEEIRKFYEK